MEEGQVQILCQSNTIADPEMIFLVQDVLLACCLFVRNSWRRTLSIPWLAGEKGGGVCPSGGGGKDHAGSPPPPSLPDLAGAGRGVGAAVPK